MLALMKCIAHFLLALTLAASLVGCATSSDIQVRSKAEPDVDFATIKTYAWHPELNKPTGNPRVNDKQLNAWIRAAVNADLQAKGLTLNADDPDVYVGYAAALRRKLDTVAINSQYGYAPGWGNTGSANVGYRRYTPNWSPKGKSTYRYDEGSLILDVIDASSRDLLRRSAAQTRANEVERSDEERRERVEEAVQRMLKGFPR